MNKTTLAALALALFPFLGKAANTPPTIATINNQAVYVDHPALIMLNVGDAETAVPNLQLSLVSSNPALVSAENVAFHYLNSQWHLTVVPTFGVTGTAINTVTVSDGTNSTSTNFVLIVTAPPAGAVRFVNTNAMTIPNGGAATPYPSMINVTGMSGTITNLDLTVSKFGHEYPDDVSMLLVSPMGVGFVIFSKVGGGRGVTNVTFTLTDAGAFPLPNDSEIWSEQFRPANYATTNFFTAPAPSGPYGSGGLSNSFNGLSANGTWSLYVYDEGFLASHGAIAGGWSLMVATRGGTGSPPTISDIADATVPLGTPGVQRPFTINDTDTPVDSLTLNKGSSNPALVPTNNIVLGGTGTGRTVTVTPVAGQRSSAAITVSVSDGINSTSDTFILTVNGPPTLTAITNQTIVEDTSTAALSFTVGDVESVAGSLTLSGGSSDPTLVPTNNIVFGGSASNRTVRVSPATNQHGSATITMIVSDGLNSVSTNFELTVRAVNDPPTLTGIANQMIDEDTGTAVLSFLVGDVETPADSLTVSGGSSDPTLVPTSRIVFGGSGANRTVTVSPATNQNGSATITVRVSDGTNIVSMNFVLTVNVVNDAPTLTAIANQTIDEDKSTAALPFTINDAETPVASLTLSKGSSNPTLVPANNIVLGGSGANRTVTVIPATNQNGTATITLSVSDGTNSVSTNFLVTVSAVNDAPTISDIPDQFTQANIATPALTFTINDVETPVDSLTLSGGSSNPTLVPANRIVFGGTGANRTVTVAPATDQTGSATITVTVSDGTKSTNETFLLVVGNASPTIGTIADQTVYVDHPILVALNVGDAETAGTNLLLNLVSSNPALVSADNVVFHYLTSDGHWYLTVVPTFGLTGVATNTVTVSDGTRSASTNFVLTVNPPPAGAVRFVNANAITIPEVGAATAYPSTINVAGMSGTITNMTLTLSKINHQYIQDVHILLVGPTGPGMVVFSRISRYPVTNITATLTDSSPFPLPGDGSDLWSEQFKPTDLATTNGTFTDNNFPAPAPAGPYGLATFSNSFNGRSANGTWSLYVYDHHERSAGTIAGGWSLMIGTTTGGVPQLRILSLTGAGTPNVVINWSAISNVNYRVQYLSDLNTTSWSDLVPDVRATSSVASAIDPLATTARRFYRIRVVP